MPWVCGVCVGGGASRARSRHAVRGRQRGLTAAQRPPNGRRLNGSAPLPQRREPHPAAPFGTGAAETPPPCLNARLRPGVFLSAGLVPHTGSRQRVCLNARFNVQPSVPPLQLRSREIFETDHVTRYESKKMYLSSRYCALLFK